MVDISKCNRLLDDGFSLLTVGESKIPNFTWSENQKKIIDKREFEKRYHESPMKWFQDRRLEYAFRLMKEEQKRPSDIYLEVGYESLSSFIQAYKLKYGMTPKRHHKI